MTFTPATNSNTNALQAVWGNATAIIAVGSSGTIRRSTDGGATFGTRVSGTSQTLAQIWGSGSTFVVAGGQGTILRSVDDGASFGARTSGTSAYLSTLHGAGATLIAAGTAVIIRSDDGGATWSTASHFLPVGLGHYIYGVRVTTDGRALAVGVNGTALLYDP